MESIPIPRNKYAQSNKFRWHCYRCISCKLICLFMLGNDRFNNPNIPQEVRYSHWCTLSSGRNAVFLSSWLLSLFPFFAEGDSNNLLLNRNNLGEQFYCCDICYYTLTRQFILSSKASLLSLSSDWVWENLAKWFQWWYLDGSSYIKWRADTNILLEIQWCRHYVMDPICKVYWNSCFRSQFNLYGLQHWIIWWWRRKQLFHNIA